MLQSNHFMKRAKQRGITYRMVQFALKYGEVKGEHSFINKKILDDLINNLTKELMAAKRLRDKGGIVIVSDKENLITTFDFDSYRKY
ncbi:DUF4258 domain-containing protein [Acinetobacter variabilis]|uniref:DUF4258 domain-containing protein n=1 Tax=Acinetobacter variabilis TaxID=70346 RepID=UPI003AF79D3B